MDSFQLLLDGFAIALQPQNLLLAVVGCALGTLIGVLPGIGPAAGTAMLIPITIGLGPVAAIIMLAAIYYGAMYGGTITSVLINTPGEAASAITCLEGYEMAKRGRAGPALAVAAIGSFVGGTFATMGLVLLALPLTSIALSFGPPEFFALMVAGLALVVALAGTSILRAMIAALLGLLIAMIGIDPVMGAPRFTFGQVELLDGLNIVPVVMGLFGIGEVLASLEKPSLEAIKTPFRSLAPSRSDLRESSGAIARGSVIGFGLGLIPGVNSIVAAFMSYIAEKKVARRAPWGTGVIQGVAGPETANNAHANAALIPLFTLGIPSGSTIAILMGAFTINGIVPGPLLFRDHPEVVWPVIASLYLGNAILVVLNLPLIPVWVAALRIPRPILFAIIVGFSIIGSYSLSNSVWDVGVMLVFGVIGYAAKKLDFPLAPAVLTLVLAPLLEQALRQSLDMSRGDFAIFFTRPIAVVVLAVAAVFVFISVRGVLSTVREDVE